MTTFFPILFGCGNPLLDISVTKDEDYLKKYNLPKNGYCFQGKEQDGIYEDMKMCPKVKYIAGGATLNSIRVCQGLTKIPGSAFYTGCIAKDDFGNIMSTLCDEEGLVTEFAYSKTKPTGVCGVTVVGRERSLCTRLGAAEDYTLLDLKLQWSHLEKARIAYSAGFFLSVAGEGMRQIGDHCSKNNKIFCTNLSATFFIEFCKDEMMALMPFVDFLFGNETEAAHFAKVHGWGSDIQLEEVAVRIAQLPKANTSKARVVIITQGNLPTIVASKWLQSDLWKITKYPVVQLSENEIIDTNAAGDAFVGGFLYGLVQATLKNAPIDMDVCIYFAHLAARHIVQRHGCSFEFTDADRQLETQ